MRVSNYIVLRPIELRKLYTHYMLLNIQRARMPTKLQWVGKGKKVKTSRISNSDKNNSTPNYLALSEKKKTKILLEKPKP